MFPICDIRGRVIAFGGRTLEEPKNGEKLKQKYINSPENVVYTKGRHLFGLNVAKKSELKNILIVEGYMDVISLHQRGIKNVVAPLGTALTPNQGWLLQRNAEKIILGFDSDDSGQKAILRSIEILQNMGCDMRVLQMEGAKDPDEYILKYGNARFQNLMDKAISVIEYKVKTLKKDLNLENAADKIKFLNEISKLISTVENNMEREVYIENIARQYNISKEAIYAEVNKLKYSKKINEKVLEKTRVVTPIKIEVSNVSEKIKKREDTILSLLLDENFNVYEIIKQNVKAEDFKYEIDRKIAIKVYEEFEKGNSNINSIIDNLTEEEQSHVTAILAEDYGIENTEKAIDDLLKNYEKEKLLERKQEIINLRGQNLSKEEQDKLLSELSEIIYKIAKIK